MMRKRLFQIIAGTMLLAGATTLFSSCETNEGDDEFGEMPESGKVGGYTMSSMDGAGGDGYGDAGGEGGEAGPQGVNSQAGVVTAGEWCDLLYWPYWSKLMQGDNYGDKADYWKFYTNNRVAVLVTDASGKAVAGVSVKLQREDGNKPSWEAVTDNHGEASCWVGLYQQEMVNASSLRIIVDGQQMKDAPVLCPWDSLQGNEALAKVSEKCVNHYVITPKKTPKQQADIAFIVDATGSMSDEINFLKNDLEDIINKTASLHSDIKMRTAALFYRDEDDEYLTRHSNFTDRLDKTREFVSEQSAMGGGDYPEAVHTALEKMLQNLSWDNDARTRLAFLILDAPAHHQTDVISSLQKSVQQCARQGIRLIPVAASGVDKNTEFMLRFFAIATGGTYVFLTNDSGVGNSHIAASVGPYEVEQLNSLIVRLISHYTE
jgi:hypothetical protein